MIKIMVVNFCIKLNKISFKPLVSFQCKEISAHQWNENLYTIIFILLWNKYKGV